MKLWHVITVTALSPIHGASVLGREGMTSAHTACAEVIDAKDLVSQLELARSLEPCFSVRNQTCVLDLSLVPHAQVSRWGVARDNINVCSRACIDLHIRSTHSVRLYGLFKPGRTLPGSRRPLRTQNVPYHRGVLRCNFQIWGFITTLQNLACPFLDSRILNAGSCHSATSCPWQSRHALGSQFGATALTLISTVS